MPINWHPLGNLLLTVVNVSFYYHNISNNFLYKNVWNNELSLLFSVIVESGNIISFVAYINSGYCKIYRNIVGLSKTQSKRVVSFNLMCFFKSDVLWWKENIEHVFLCLLDIYWLSYFVKFLSIFDCLLHLFSSFYSVVRYRNVEYIVRYVELYNLGMTKKDGHPSLSEKCKLKT